MALNGDWKVIVAICSVLAATCLAGARGLWWLSEQFRKTRHAQAGNITALGLEIDALNRRIDQLEYKEKQRDKDQQRDGRRR